VSGLIVDINFRSAGSDVKIHPQAKLIGPENIVFGSHIIIDDFVFIGAHRNLIIGNYVHISSHVSITGGGDCLLCDFCGISTGARLLSGSDEIHSGKLTGPTIPEEFRSVTRGRVVVGAHAVVFANAVVLPNIRIGEGAVAAAGAVVTRDLEPWTIYAGVPARRVGTRAPEGVLSAEQALIAGVPSPLVRYRDETALARRA
jgi:acetyltransferase-like isoleucine patch superfamily enzyme